MKRYQCIKNVYVTLTYGQDVTTSARFKAGKPYNFTYNGQWWEAVDEFGTTHIATDVFMAYFQELPDINIDDHEEEQYTAMFPKTNRLGLGCAIVIAVALTVLALIFFG